MEITALVCLGVFLYLCYVYLKPKFKGKLPDGPRGIPIFGNALQLNKKTSLLDICLIGEKFGDAFTLNLYGERVVVLNSYDVMKEALVSPEYAVTFSGRPPGFVSKYIFTNDVGFTTYSKEWSVLRKIVFKGLKTYGTNLADMEELIQGEIKYLLERMDKESGKAVDPGIYITGYVTSVNSIMITGRHLKQEDEQLRLVAGVTDCVDRLTDPTTMQLFTMCPWLRFIPIGGGKLYRKLQQKVDTMMKGIEENRQKRSDGSERKRSFLDLLYEEKDKGNITQENIAGVVLDLLAAGTSTTRSTLYSLLLILTARPDIQQRLQEEIDQTIGRSCLPCLSDRNSMPYTQAVIWETLRLYATDPITLPRSTMEDVKIRDYHLPKGTQIFYNIWLVMHDEKFWEDPYVFNPSRYLDDTGNLVPPENEKRQRTIAFGLGKRACLGESIARIRIFLAFISILQKFDLVADPSHPLPDTDPRTFIADGILDAPQYKMVFKSRAV